MFPPTPCPHHVRTGCDLTQISDVESSLSTFGQRYLDRMFTASEQTDSAGALRLQRLAARYAAKEAAIKAFAVPEAAFVPREMEVVLTDHVPSLRLTGAAQRLALEQNWLDVSLSLSHTDCHAMAVITVICAGARKDCASAHLVDDRSADPGRG